MSSLAPQSVTRPQVACRRLIGCIRSSVLLLDLFSQQSSYPLPAQARGNLILITSMHLIDDLQRLTIKELPLCWLLR